MVFLLLPATLVYYVCKGIFVPGARFATVEIELDTGSWVIPSTPGVFRSSSCWLESFSTTQEIFQRTYYVRNSAFRNAGFQVMIPG